MESHAVPTRAPAPAEPMPVLASIATAPAPAPGLLLQAGGCTRTPGIAAALALCLSLIGCATTPPPSGPGTWAGRPLGPPPPPNPAVKQALISRATGEWERFGRQTVVLKRTGESISHIGSWEDDDDAISQRVNAYWRVAGKGGLDGMDCRQPWSAAFISWIMQGSGVPEHQFRPAPAHWIYLAGMIEEAGYPGRWFVPRRIADYSPKPGDLVCASRGSSHPVGSDGYTSAWMLRGSNTHCDLVVAKSGQTLEAIGGNVRNSVSKTTLELDSGGRLQPLSRRPWFLILENRL